MWLESQLRVLFAADTYYQLQRPGGCGDMVCIVLADMFLILGVRRDVVKVLVERLVGHPIFEPC